MAITEVRRDIRRQTLIVSPKKVSPSLIITLSRVAQLAEQPLLAAVCLSAVE